MKLYVLFAAQESDCGMGFYPPEALCVIADHDHDHNPDYIYGQLKEAQKDSRWSVAKVIIVDAGDLKKVEDLLHGFPEVKGEAESVLEEPDAD